MAGDWIKIEHALPGKPEVMAMAAELGISELEVVGHLVCFWTWVDQNLSEKCPAVSGTKTGLDRVAGRTGFAQAMLNAGWLKMENGLIEIPNYESHLSQTAKARSVEAKRKQKQRQKMSQDVPDNFGTKRGTEKRREEKNTNTVIPPNPPLGGKAGNKKPESVTLDKIKIPASLDTQECRKAITDWLAYKREKKQAYKSAEAVNRLVERFARDGPAAFCEAVYFSMGQNWNGCFAPKGKSNGKPSTEQQQLNALERAIAKAEQEERSVAGTGPAREGLPRLPAG